MKGYVTSVLPQPTEETTNDGDGENALAQEEPATVCSNLTTLKIPLRCLTREACEFVLYQLLDYVGLMLSFLILVLLLNSIKKLIP